MIPNTSDHFIQNAEPSIQKRKEQPNTLHTNSAKKQRTKSLEAKTQNLSEKDANLVKIAKEFIIKKGLSIVNSKLFPTKRTIVESFYKQTRYTNLRSLKSYMSKKIKTDPSISLWEIVEKEVKEIFAKNYKDPDFSISEELKSKFRSEISSKTQSRTRFVPSDNDLFIKLAVHYIFRNFEIGLNRINLVKYMLPKVNTLLIETGRTPLTGDDQSRIITSQMKRANLWLAVESEWKRIQNGDDTPKETVAKVEVTPNFQGASFSENAVIGSQNMIMAQPHENLPQSSSHKHDLKFLLNPILQLDTDDSQSQNDPTNPSELLQPTPNSISNNNNNNYFQTL